MMDICFRFDDESTARTQLARFINANGTWMMASHVHALDVVGTLYVPIDTTGLDPENLPMPAKLPGFHVNLRIWGGLMEAIGQELASSKYVVIPMAPQRVWA